MKNTKTTSGNLFDDISVERRRHGTQIHFEERIKTVNRKQSENNKHIHSRVQTLQGDELHCNVEESCSICYKHHRGFVIIFVRVAPIVYTNSVHDNNQVF